MNFLNPMKIAVAILVLSLFLVGCDEETSNPVDQDNAHAPEIESVTASMDSVLFGTSVTVTCVATDLDQDSLSYVWDATGGSFSGDADSSSVVWIAPNTVGAQTLTVIVSDSTGETEGSVVITVLDGDVPPQILSVEASSDTVVSCGTVALTCLAEDLNGDELSYSWECAEGEFIEGADSTSAVWEAPRGAVGTGGSYYITLIATVTEGTISVKDSCQVFLAGYPFEITPVLPKVENTGDSPVVTLGWTHISTGYDNLIQYNVKLFSESDDVLLDTLIIGSKEMTFDDLEYYANYRLVARFNLPEEVEQYASALRFNVGGTRDDQLVINPVALGDYWAYKITAITLAPSSAPDTSVYLDTCRVVDQTTGTGPDPSYEVYTLEGPVRSGPYTLLSDGWYHYSEDEAEWKMVLPLKWYPQPIDTYLEPYENNRSTRVIDVDATVETDTQTYTGCYQVKMEYYYDSGMTTTSINESWWYKEGIGLVKYEYSSSAEVIYTKRVVLQETNVGP